jgi:hypothetical protein
MVETSTSRDLLHRPSPLGACSGGRVLLLLLLSDSQKPLPLLRDGASNSLLHRSLDVLALVFDSLAGPSADPLSRPVDLSSFPVGSKDDPGAENGCIGIKRG